MYVVKKLQSVKTPLWQVIALVLTLKTPSINTKQTCPYRNLHYK